MILTIKQQQNSRRNLNFSNKVEKNIRNIIYKKIYIIYKKVYIIYKKVYIIYKKNLKLISPGSSKGTRRNF